MLEDILANIRKKGLEKKFALLEISTIEGTFRVPLEKITGLSFVEE